MIKIYEKGYKKTKVRDTIYQIVDAASKHARVLSIKEINQLYLEKKGKISFETLYDNVYLFESEGDFAKVLIDNKIYYYINSEKHCSHKAVCVKCHNFIDLNYCPTREILKHLPSGLKVLNHNLTVEITCERCG